MVTFVVDGEVWSWDDIENAKPGTRIYEKFHKYDFLFEDRDMGAPFVYFLLAHDPTGTGGLSVYNASFLKIGVANDPRERVKGFQTGCPFELNIWTVARGGYALEKRLHKYFEQWRVLNSEWFLMTEEVIDVMQNAPEDDPTYTW